MHHCLQWSAEININAMSHQKYVQQHKQIRLHRNCLHNVPNSKQTLYIVIKTRAYYIQELVNATAANLNT